ncbi:MAG: hypothetical protein KUF75_07815 [Candidatus Thiodiazotropha sp. (ex Ctena orbiculata)]|nr:hypothetical protein [Candidatus Thiodiazotropha taylori]
MSRKGIDQGFQKTIAWLSGWYGELDDVQIVESKLPPFDVSVPTIEKDPDYKAACVGKQTPLHKYLKYRVLKQLCQSEHNPVFEAQFYIPDEELVQIERKYGRSTVVNGFDTAKPQLINSNTLANCSNGEILVTDVYQSGSSFEIGYTTPYNLFAPFLDNLVDVVTWVPFPKGLKPNTFDLHTHNAHEYTIYTISTAE